MAADGSCEVDRVTAVIAYQGCHALGFWDDPEWGMINRKLSALLGVG